MVQVTKVRQLQPDGSEKTVHAVSYDKRANKDFPCLCPDPNCSARMGHVKEHDHHYFDRQTGEAVRLRIPAYFRRLPASPPHAESCSVALAYQRMAEGARAFGGKPRGGGYVFNLNIMTDNRPGRIRTAPPAIAAQQKDLQDSHARAAGYAPRRRSSESIGDIANLAKLLEQTAFDPAQRQTMTLRDGGSLYSLAEIYEEDPADFFRKRHALAKDAKARGLDLRPHAPAAFLFRPIAIPRAGEKIFWNAQRQTILGQPARVKGVDDTEYAPCVRLHFTSSALYHDITMQIRGGVRSYLVYDDRAHVDLGGFSRRKQEIKNGGRGHAVFVDMQIVRDGQITAWSPPKAQMEFAPRSIKLPFQSRPGLDL